MAVVYQGQFYLPEEESPRYVSVTDEQLDSVPYLRPLLNQRLKELPAIIRAEYGIEPTQNEILGQVWTTTSEALKDPVGYAKNQIQLVGEGFGQTNKITPDEKALINSTSSYLMSKNISTDEIQNVFNKGAQKGYEYVQRRDNPRDSFFKDFVRGALSAPGFSLALSYFLPGIGSAIGAQLTAANVITNAAISNAVGTAMASAALQMAQGASFEDAIKNATVNAIIQTGSPGVATEINKLVKIPAVSYAITSAGASALKTAAAGGSAADIERNMIGAIAGSATASATGNNIAGATVGGGVTGGFEGALAGGVGAYASEKEAERIAKEKAAADAKAKPTASVDYEKTVNDIITKELNQVMIAGGGAAAEMSAYARALENANKPLLRLVQEAANDPNYVEKLGSLEKYLFNAGTSIAKVLGTRLDLLTYSGELNKGEAEYFESQEFKNRLRDAEIQRLKQPLPQTEIQPGSRDVTTVNVQEPEVIPPELRLPLDDPNKAFVPPPPLILPPVIKPTPTVKPSPVPLPEPKPVPKPEPKPVPKPEPKPVPKPEPKPEPKPVFVPVPIPEPQPLPLPQPQPQPQPQPLPRPSVTPTPVVTPRPSVAPAPVPLPVIAPSTSPAPSVTPTTSPNLDADILKLIQPAPAPSVSPAPAPSVSPAPQPEVRPAPVPRPKPSTPSRLPSLVLPTDIPEPPGGGTPSRPPTAQPGTGEEPPIEEIPPVEEPVEEPVPTPDEEPELPPVEDKTGTPVEKLYRPNLFVYGGTRPTTLPQTLGTSVENVPTAGTTTGTSVGLGGRGEIESKESGKKRKTVWNEESLRLKDALGL